jgi:hypothetical protein
MLRIFHTHPARTSLLQDFAFYEVMHCNIIRVLSNSFKLLPATIHSKDANPGRGSWDKHGLPVSAVTTDQLAVATCPATASVCFD